MNPKLVPLFLAIGLFLTAFAHFVEKPSLKNLMYGAAVAFAIVVALIVLFVPG